MTSSTTAVKSKNYEWAIVNHPVYGVVAQIRIANERVVCQITEASDEEIQAMTDALNALAAH